MNARLAAASFLLALALSVSIAAVSNASAHDARASARSGTLVAYRKEGGIGGPHPSLAVSTMGWAVVSNGRCEARFELGPKRWRHLRATLADADIPSIAGSYSPPPKGADFLIFYIRAGVDFVRIPAMPREEDEEVLAQLEPLVRTIRKIVPEGVQRVSDSCEDPGDDRPSPRVLPRFQPLPHSGGVNTGNARFSNEATYGSGGTGASGASAGTALAGA